MLARPPVRGSVQLSPHPGKEIAARHGAPSSFANLRSGSTRQPRKGTAPGLRSCSLTSGSHK
eukprot:2716697-Alexandrium_andersonii.AAC.1